MKKPSLGIVIFLLFVSIFAWFRLNTVLASILTNNSAVRIVFAIHQDSSLAIAEKLLNKENVMYSCRRAWLQSQIAKWQNQWREAREFWLVALACSPNYVDLIRIYVPNDQELAEISTVLQPESASAWFWLAAVVSDQTPSKGIEYYRRGLALDGTDGRSWLALGDLLRPVDHLEAIKAYLQSCHYGDPGSNGCFRAGLLAEAIGEYEAAIQYYRLSRWSGAHELADRLEIRLQTGELP